jgi:CRP-like cAMP-binding protein
MLTRGRASVNGDEASRERRQNGPSARMGRRARTRWETGMPAQEGSMATTEETLDSIAGITLFADLTAPQLEAIAHQFEERLFGPGERIVRQGVSGSGLFIIIEGAASVLHDGNEKATLGRGDFFGDLSVLLGEPPVADVVAVTTLRCLVIASGDVERFLVTNPKVMFRMMQALARRLRIANKWRS